MEENSPFLVAKTESRSPSRQEFTDESGNGRVGRLMQGDVRVGLDDGHDVSIEIPFVERSADTVIQWNSAFRGRLLQCQDSNWLHGHHSDKAGVMHYDAWNGGSSQLASVSSSSDWMVTCGRNVVSSGSVSTIVNRVSQSTGGGGAGNCALGINNYADEHRDWQLSKLCVWDYHLSDSMLSSANCRKMDNSDGNDQNNISAHSASPKTIYLFAVLGLLVALLLMTVDAIKWVGLTHGVLEWNVAKEGAYKAKSNFALVLLILISQVGTVQPEPRYECSSTTSCRRWAVEHGPGARTPQTAPRNGLPTRRLLQQQGLRRRGRVTTTGWRTSTSMPWRPKLWGQRTESTVPRSIPTLTPGKPKR